MTQNNKRRKRRSYSDEFKRDAVDLVLSTQRPIAQVAEELGVGESTLGNWVRKEREIRAAEDAPGGLDRDERAEYEAMKAELAEVRMERDLLKRTVAFWVKESTS